MIEFHPRALQEARKARRWYHRRSPGAANRLMLELDHAIAQIESGPQQWPPYLHGTRFYKLRRFPYLAVFRETPTNVQIVAIAHSSRRPGYWRKRLP